MQSKAVRVKLGKNAAMRHSIKEEPQMDYSKLQNGSDIRGIEGSFFVSLALKRACQKIIYRWKISLYLYIKYTGVQLHAWQ